MFSESIVTIVETIQFFPKVKTCLGFSRVNSLWIIFESLHDVSASHLEALEVEKPKRREDFQIRSKVSLKFIHFNMYKIIYEYLIQ